MAENIFNGNGTDSGSGGGGGTPADYNQVKEQVAQNKSDIATIKAEQTAQNASISDLQQSQLVQDNAIAKNSGNIDRIADKAGIDLSIEYQPLQANQAVKLSGVSAIDTGLFMDGNAEFSVKGGVVAAGKQAILVGAYNSNSERTALKLLSGSKKIQSQWANNAEITDLNGIDLLQPISYVQDKDKAVITQGDITLNIANGGFNGVSDTTKIYLFNQTETGIYNGGYLSYAKITQGGTAYEFKPMRKIKDGVDLGFVMLKNGKELALKGGVLELVEF